MTAADGLRITRLTADSFLRLHAVDISPDAGAAVVEIRGRNAQGKTSVLNAIAAAIGGREGAKLAGPAPIHDGAERAVVTVHLADQATGADKYVVTRIWDHSAGGGKLLVESPDGARYTKPQALLDSFLGDLTFDPLAFANAPAKEQRDLLLRVAVLPFNPHHLADERQGLYEQRTDVARDAKRLEGALASMPDVPEVAAVDVADVMQELRRAELAAEAHAALVQRAEWAEADVIGNRSHVLDLEQQLVQARIDVEVSERLSAEADEALRAAPRTPDLDGIRERITTAGAANAAHADWARRQQVAGELAMLQAQVADLTAQMAELDRRKADGLAAATLPLDGIGFDDDGVTYQGQPFVQASGAERLRVSLAMAMALAPHLKVIRITDASLLDSDSMALVHAMAEEGGYQVWLEVVADDAGAAGFYIEDGGVA